MTMSDLARLINSDEIQSVVRPAQAKSGRNIRKKNPLKNFGFMVKLNPYALKQKRDNLLAGERAAKAPKVDRRKEAAKKAAVKRRRQTLYNDMLSK